MEKTTDRRDHHPIEVVGLQLVGAELEALQPKDEPLPEVAFAPEFLASLGVEAQLGDRIDLRIEGRRMIYRLVRWEPPTFVVGRHWVGELVYHE